jgi:hypothetical protein
MQEKREYQGTILKFSDDLKTWIDAFLVDRKAQNLSRTTVYFYQKRT